MQGTAGDPRAPRLTASSESINASWAQMKSPETTTKRIRLPMLMSATPQATFMALFPGASGWGSRSGTGWPSQGLMVQEAHPPDRQARELLPFYPRGPGETRLGGARVILSSTKEPTLVVHWGSLPLAGA